MVVFTFVWVLHTLSPATPIVPVHQDALRVCVVQLKEIYEEAFVSGHDAQQLTSALSVRSLQSGRPLLAFAIFGFDSKGAEQEADRQQCAYTVTLRHHQGLDGAFSSPSIPDLPTPPSPANDIPSMHDYNAVFFELRETGKRKVIQSGSSPPVVHHGKSGTVTAPFPFMARQIVAKLSTLPK